MGTKLLMSTSFHPQIDGATERANMSIGQMFQAIIKPDQRNWVEKSPLIKFAINASIENAMGLTPFKINYGVYAHNDKGDESDGENTTRCKNICLKCSKEHDTSAQHANKGQDIPTEIC